MNKIKLLFVLIGLSGFTLYSQKLAYVPRATSQPVMDGIHEVLWDSAHYARINAYYGGTIDDSLDFSVRWKAMWDMENLYFFVEVTDDTLFNYGPGAAKFWIHDCVEIFFDLLNDKDNIDTDETPSDDNYQYRFIWNLDDEPIWEDPPSEGLVNVSRSRKENNKTIGYNVEIKFPWSTLIQIHPFAGVIVGRSIGLEFKIADLDSPGVPDAQWWPDAELCWNNDTRNGLKVSSNFGTIVLVNDLLPDHTPPSPVSDLAGSPAGSSSALLTWTSTGDDAMEGLATSYEIRYSTDSITGMNWDQATLSDTIPVPLISGTVQSIKILNVPKGTDLYFAIRIIDEAGNYSDVSNVIHIRTFDPDLIPPSGITDLKADSTGSFAVYLSWTAPGDDGESGTVWNYEIRYSTSEINHLNWNEASLFPDSPEPVEYGNSQHFTLDMLSPKSTYYIAVKGYDEEPNYGPLSNVVQISTPEYVPGSVPDMADFIGINGFIDDPLNILSVAGFIREYHPWDWDAGGIAFPNNKPAWNPSYAGGAWPDTWDFDAYYQMLYNAGITVCPCVMNNVDWLTGTETDKPLDTDTSAWDDPNSYKAHADHMFQYAARFGQTQVPDSLLKLEASQLRISGLGVLKYLENWNEPDRDWAGRASYFSPEELAAMCSADYDGHCSTMGNIFGVKNADPKMKMSIGGLTSPNVEYIKSMYTWFKANRADQKFAADILNIHQYSGNQSPEDSKLRERLLALTDYRNRYLPDAEVWITEFGWDTGDFWTIVSAPVISSLGKEDVQAMWLVRAYLIISSTGVDKAAMYMIRDVQNNGAQQFSTCGLVHEKNDWSPKPAWYYVYTMKNILTGYRFADIINSLNPSVWIYKYLNNQSDTSIYAVWTPTSSGKTISNYRLSLPSGTKSASKISLVNGSKTGTTEVMNISRNGITFDVTEKPVFIIATANGSSGFAEKTESQDIRVYPNPASDFIYIQRDQEWSENLDISICDPAGRVISAMKIKGHDNELIRIDIHNLLSGLYIIKIKTGTGVVTGRIFKY